MPEPEGKRQERYIQVPFSKWSCGGNTTLFFPANLLALPLRASFASQAQHQQELAAEQAGFIDCQHKRLIMAGGEFCLNATRAFAACLALEEEKADQMETCTARVTVSGWQDPISLTCQGHAPLWEVEAHLTLPGIPITEIEPGLISVSLPGITHLLLDRRSHPLSDHPSAETFLKEQRKRCALEKAACVGCIWWEQRAETFTITPLVYVHATKTLFWEQACGSGSLALALYLTHLTPERTRFCLRQPSKDTLTVTLDDPHRAAVAGSVRLISMGSFFWELPADNEGKAGRERQEC